MLDVYLISVTFLGLFYFLYFKGIKQVRFAKNLAVAIDAGDTPLQIKTSSFWSEFLTYAAPSAFVIMFIKQFYLDMMVIPSASMLPNYPIGVTVFVDTNQYGTRMPVTQRFLKPPLDPSPGDVAVMQFPLNTNVNYIKRVIATSNDTLQADPSGITLNGRHYPYRHIETRDYAIKSEQTAHDVYEITLDGATYRVINRVGIELPTIPFQRIPIGTMYVLGDNYTASSDSRDFGVVPLFYLIGGA